IEYGRWGNACHCNVQDGGVAAREEGLYARGGRPEDRQYEKGMLCAYPLFCFRSRSPVYYNAFTCFWILLLRLPALLAWMMFLLASLSSMALTFGRSASAAALSVVLRSAFTALRAVL